MKVLSTFIAIIFLAATNASANIENVEMVVEKIKPTQIVFANPKGAPSLQFALGETCVLRLTTLVEVPVTFRDADEQMALACAVR